MSFICKTVYTLNPQSSIESEDLWASKCILLRTHMQSSILTCRAGSKTYRIDKFDPMPQMDSNRALLCFADLLEQVIKLNTIGIVNNRIRTSCIGTYRAKNGALRFVLNDYGKCERGIDTSIHDLIMVLLDLDPNTECCYRACRVYYPLIWSHRTNTPEELSESPEFINMVAIARQAPEPNYEVEPVEVVVSPPSPDWEDFPTLAHRPPC